eukprot:1189384-Prorocentrum_minimum.AAC.2
MHNSRVDSRVDLLLTFHRPVSLSSPGGRLAGTEAERMIVVDPLFKGLPVKDLSKGRMGRKDMSSPDPPSEQQSYPQQSYPEASYPSAPENWTDQREVSPPTLLCEDMPLPPCPLGAAILPGGLWHVRGSGARVCVCTCKAALLPRMQSQGIGGAFANFLAGFTPSPSMSEWKERALPPSGNTFSAAELDEIYRMGEICRPTRLTPGPRPTIKGSHLLVVCANRRSFSRKDR